MLGRESETCGTECWRPQPDRRFKDMLIGTVLVLESIFALTESGLGRTNRAMRLNQLLRDQGIESQEYWTGFGQNPTTARSLQSDCLSVRSGRFGRPCRSC